MKLISIAALATTALAGSSIEDAGPFVNETWYSGLIEVPEPNRTRGDIFYWWFESRDDPKNDPLVLWLTGGPGCASEIALFYENGPYKIGEDNQTIVSNPHSWNSHANLLYVDQPVGTGFSNAEDRGTHNEDQVA